MENGAKGAQVTPPRIACLCTAVLDQLRLAFLITRTLSPSTHSSQVIVKGKVRAQRAKAMKFGDGYMVSSGHPAKIYLEKAFTHVQMRQGSIGIKVRLPRCYPMSPSL
jgi:ribosomal protein S3